MSRLHFGATYVVHLPKGLLPKDIKTKVEDEAQGFEAKVFQGGVGDDILVRNDIPTHQSYTLKKDFIETVLPQVLNTPDLKSGEASIEKEQFLKLLTLYLLENNLTKTSADSYSRHSRRPYQFYIPFTDNQHELYLQDNISHYYSNSTHNKIKEDIQTLFNNAKMLTQEKLKTLGSDKPLWTKISEAVDDLFNSPNGVSMLDQANPFWQPPA